MDVDRTVEIQSVKISPSSVCRHISIVSEFELQCSTWKVSIVDGMFFAGILIGASSFGYLSDRIGTAFSH